jgi:hypothetical protein
VKSHDCTPRPLLLFQKSSGNLVLPSRRCIG